MTYKEMIYEMMKDQKAEATKGLRFSNYDNMTFTCTHERSNKIPEIKKVIWNKNACVVIWKDDTKTVVNCQEGDVWNNEVGLMAAFSKKLFGNDNTFNKIINRYCSPFFNENERIQNALEKMERCFDKAFNAGDEDKLLRSVYLSGTYETEFISAYCIGYKLPGYAKEFIKLANQYFKTDMEECNVRLSVVETKDNTFKIVLVEQEGEKNEVQE